MVQHLVNIFKTKPKHLFPILAQIYDSDHTSNPNLTKSYIKKQLDTYEIIIVWEGSTDYKILKKLNVVAGILTLRGWDQDNNGQFYLQLINMDTKSLITTQYIGKFNKNGRALSLSEAHSITCGREHLDTEPHNPKTDVIHTECLFQHLQKRYELTFDNIYS